MMMLMALIMLIVTPFAVPLNACLQSYGNNPEKLNQQPNLLWNRNFKQDLHI